MRRRAPALRAGGGGGRRVLGGRAGRDPRRPATTGFVFAAREDAVTEGGAVSADIGGRTYALFRVDGRVRAIDGQCPHEGGPLAEGTLAKGVVTCPWHGWTFDACSGCSLDPAGNDVAHYPTFVEEGNVYLQPKQAPATTPQPTAGGVLAAVSSPGAQPPRPATASLTVAEIRDETPDVRTFRLDNRDGRIPHAHPGDVSPGLRADRRRRDVAQLHRRVVARRLVVPRADDQAEPVWAGDEPPLRDRPHRRRADRPRHAGRLLLRSGSPPRAARAGLGGERDHAGHEHRALSRRRPTRGTPASFIHGARTEDDIIFRAECRRLRGHVALPRLTTSRCRGPGRAGKAAGAGWTAPRWPRWLRTCSAAATSSAGPLPSWMRSTHGSDSRGCRPSGCTPSSSMPRRGWRGSDEEDERGPPALSRARRSPPPGVFRRQWIARPP